MPTAAGARFPFIKISTDEGIVGWAETSEGMAGPGLIMVIRRLAERLIGRDPRDVGPIGTDLYVATQMAHGGLMAQAIAALENACLDIKGKAAGLPVYALFGGAHRTRLPLYWSHCGTYRVRSAELFERVNKTPPIRTLDDIKKLGQEVIAPRLQGAQDQHAAVRWRAATPISAGLCRRRRTSGIQSVAHVARTRSRINLRRFARASARRPG